MIPATARPSRVQAAAIAAAVLLAGGLLWWLLAGGEAPRPPPPAVPVGVALSEQRDVPHVVRGIGTVESLHHVTLRSQVDGILAEVLFREGQFVREGALLARIDDRALAAALAQAEADRARNEAQLRAAEQDLTRYANLLKEEAISRQAVDQQEALVGQLRAAVRASEAAIAAARVQLSYTRIVAPVSGRVGLRRVDPGNLVRAGDAEGLVTVTQMDPISVVFTLPQSLLPDLRPLAGDAAGVPVTALARDGGERLGEGRLSMIDNAIDPATGTIRLRAEFANAGGKLWPGQFVTVAMRIGESAGAVAVSPRAVRQGVDGPFVYRVRDGKAELVRVEVGYADEGVTVLTRGLGPGETVVVDGHSRLKHGAAVAVVGEPKRPGPLAGAGR